MPGNKLSLEFNQQSFGYVTWNLYVHITGFPTWGESLDRSKIINIIMLGNTGVVNQPTS